MSRLAIFKLFKPSTWRKIAPIKSGSIFSRIKRGGANAWTKVRGFASRNKGILTAVGVSGGIAFISRMLNGVQSVNVDLNDELTSKGYDMSDGGTNGGIYMYRKHKRQEALGRMAQLRYQITEGAASNNPEKAWLEFIYSYHSVINEIQDADLADFVQTANHTLGGLRSSGLRLEDPIGSSHVVSKFRRLKDDEEGVEQDVADLLSLMVLDSELELPLEVCP